MTTDISEKNIERRFFFIALALFILAGAVLLPLYRYQINPDGISYISLARKYIAGDFTHVVNGHWSPLLSWLLVPFIIFIPPLIAAKIITFGAGIVTFFGIRRLSRVFDIDFRFKIFLYIATAVYLLYTGLSLITPDLLVTGALVWYCAIVFDPDFPRRKRNGAFAGLIGGIAFLAKSYALPFFAVHFIIMTAHHFLAAERTERRRVITTALIGYAACIFAVAPWVTVISMKQGHFTISTAGAYNRALIGPGVKDHPVHTLGLFPPSNHTAISVWEDVSSIPLPAWNVASRNDAIRYQIHILAQHIRKVATIFYQFFSYLTPLILIAYTIVALRSFAAVRDRYAILILLTIAIFTGGYLFLFVEERYFWLVNIIFMLMAFSLVSRLALRMPRTALVIAAFIYISFVQYPIRELARTANGYKNVHSTAMALQKYLPAGSCIASNGEWHTTLAIAYYLNLRYYGKPRPDDDNAARLQSLQQHGITYYLVWKGRPEETLFFSRFPELTKGAVSSLSIYRLTNH